MTKREVERLKTEVEKLTQLKRDVETQLTEAQRGLFAAEREMRVGQKPTAVMLSILRKLDQGAVIKCRTYYPYHYRVVGDETQKISTTVFDGLRAREIITQGERTGLEYVYRISERGQDLIKANEESTSSISKYEVAGV